MVRNHYDLALSYIFISWQDKIILHYHTYQLIFIKKNGKKEFNKNAEEKQTREQNKLTMWETRV